MVNAVTTELFYDNAWNNITTDIRQTEDISMTWGRQDEASSVSPSKMSLAFHSPDGKYSPRNPLSPLYGKIGRNTPIRTRLGSKDSSLSLPGLEESYASTPDHASLDITGDIDLRLELELNSWRPESTVSFARKYSQTGDQRSWVWRMTDAGLLWFLWSPNGTFASAITVVSTAPVPEDFGRGAIRVTLDVNNGASGNDVKFYTAPSIGGTWTQLGATVTTSGTTSVFSSTVPVEIGRSHSSGAPGFAGEPFPGSAWAFQLLNGIGGTVVANPDFTVPHAGDTTLTDSAGRAWTLHGAAAITDSSVRYAGEVSSWPSKWDLSGKDVRVPIEASGIRRRLGQGQPTLRSAMYRGITGDNVTTPRAYWPCEDGRDSTSIGSALGHQPMRISNAAGVSLAAHGDLAASAPLPTFTTGALVGEVRSYTATNFMRCMALVDIPDSITGEPTIFYLTTTGSVYRWYLTINNGGDLRIRALQASDDTEVVNSLLDFNLLGQSCLVWIYLKKNGSNIDWQVGFANIDSGSTGVVEASVTSPTIGSATRVICGGLDGDLGGMAIGHIVVLDTDEFWDILEFAGGWAGESAAERIARLCAEEGVPLRLSGDAGSTSTVGPQRIDTFLGLVDAAAKAEQGILTDDRDAVRLLFRTRDSMYKQAPALTLDYAAGQVAPTLEPVEDDQLTRNDVTAERDSGSSARAVQETGPMSVLAPPDGVGRYDTSETFNANTDAQLDNLAGWLLNLGTVDEARYPQIAVDLTATPALTSDATQVFPGDRLQVTDPPAWLPPDAIDQLAQGGTERLSPYRHVIGFNCSPASPWVVGVVGPSNTLQAGEDEPNRVDTAGSQLASAITSTATAFDVTTTSGPRWVRGLDSPNDFPFLVKVGGEVMRVTGLSGTGTTQTFTVDRSVNGVVKAHLGMTPVSLAVPARLAL